jgi:hypothetical protein
MVLGVGQSSMPCIVSGSIAIQFVLYNMPQLHYSFTVKDEFIVLSNQFVIPQ